jgi:hypothetical protein
MRKKYEDLTGQTIGRRTVLGPVERKDHRSYWSVQCGCGSINEVRTDGIYRPCVVCSHINRKQYKLRSRPFEARYNAWTKRARKRYAVSITYEQYVSLTEIQKCHYCDAPITWAAYLNKTKAGKQHGSNLDRKDTTRPYDFDNVVVCCWRCNSGKGHLFTYDEWVQIGRLICSWRASGNPFAPSPQ